MSPLELGRPPVLPDKPTWPAQPALADYAAGARLTGFTSDGTGTGSDARGQAQGKGATAHNRLPRSQGQLDRPDTAAVASRLQLVFGNRFQVIGPIAVGGMATIFQLRHRLHHGLFVAKVLHPELADRPGVIQSFRREAAHAAQLGNHPSAIPVFDFGELDGLFFLMMPFIKGEDLDVLLQRKHESGLPMSREEVLHMAAQIASLLSFAESEGVVHGDVTPGNLRLDTFGRYRLLDFGLSEATARPSGESANSPETATSSREEGGQPASSSVRPPGEPRFFTAGTPLYASPEQIRGETMDIRTDLYALGCVMAECLAGSPIFLAESLQDIRCRHLAGDWEMPANLPEADPLAALLRRLLATRREDRLESAFELSGILHAMGFDRPEFRPATQPQPERPSAGGPRRRLSL